MNHRHAFVYFIITLMFTIPMAVQAEPPSNNPNVLDARVSALEALVIGQQDMIDDLTAENGALQTAVDDLTTRLACVSVASSSAEFFFEGCNVHVRNGAGITGSLNGLGNLIVGYNEDNVPPTPNDRTGSHNLVVGIEHTYSSFGGFVAGIENSVTGTYSSVSGGDRNTASSEGSSVSGGQGNNAEGRASSVSGGLGNTASGGQSSVSGGSINTASGFVSSVSGGSINTASGFESSVSSGLSNTASGGYSSVSGGKNNTATGTESSVSGGENNTASGTISSVSGGEINTASDFGSSILGGSGQMTTMPFETIPALP